jgi:hypothetical protein
VCKLFFVYILQKPPKQKSGGNRSGYQEGHKFQEIMWPSKKLLNIYIVEFTVCTVAPPYWSQLSCSSTSKMEKKLINSQLTFSCYHFTEKNGTNYPLSRDSTPHSYF